MKARWTQLDNGCWEWQGAKVGKYGKLHINGVFWLAHRRAWFENFGEIPEGMQVCHKCDNCICVNPEHLFLGTAKDNTQDMVCKGRGDISGLRTGDWIKNRVRGQSHPKARLSDLQIAEMRALYLGGMTQVQLAKRFGVRQGWVSKVVNGRLRI